MKKVFVDRTENTECISLFSNNAEIINAGTTITSMPQSDYNDEYKRFADEYDVRFVFDNSVPMVDFYAVPQFDIMAMDSEAGYIGTIGNSSDLGSNYPIGYIDKDRNCFLIASCGKEFLENVANWKTHKQAYDGLRLFVCKEDAKSRLEFIEIPESDSEEFRRINDVP